MSTIILFPFALILTIKANRDAKFFEGGVKWTWLTGIFKKKQSNQSKIITITEGNQSQSEQS
jgi:hypothetical protein